MRFRPAMVVVLSLPAAAHPATLRVPSQYPTIQAAVDVAAAGDTVLVAPGTYTDFEIRGSGREARTAAVFLTDGVVVRSEQGAMVTTIGPDFGPDERGSNPTRIIADRLASGAAVEGFTLTGSEGGGAQITECGTVRFVDCVFRDMSAPRLAAGAYARDSSTEFRGCEFRDLAGGFAAAIYQSASQMVIDRCLFLRCSGRTVYHDGHDYRQGEAATITGSRVAFCSGDSYGVILDDQDAGVVVEDCTFADNSFQASALAISGRQGAWRVEGCVFVGNRVSVNTAAALLGNADRGKVLNNTFVANESGLSGSAVTLYYGPMEFRNNIIAGTVTGVAIEGYSRARLAAGCNVFWNNEGGVGRDPLFPTDQQIDPLFCDGPGRDFRPAGSSPCLPENNFGLCGLIGAAEAGCEGKGHVVSLLLTEPPGAPTVFVDDASIPLTAPSLLVWRPGTSHELTVPDSQQVSPGKRYVLLGWEDGSTVPARTVVAPPVPTTYVAALDSIYTLTMTATPGGTITPAAGAHWYRYDTIVRITAQPDSGWSFSNWTGIGPAGTYSGTVADTTVKVFHPITQVANFTKDEDVTVATNPSGLRIKVDGVDYLSSASFVWQRGTVHTVETDSIQAEVAGSRLRFERWSDGKARAHTITVPNGPLTVTADFLTDHEVTFSVAGQGTVTPVDGWWQAGDTVTIEAFPGPYYLFDSWQGTGPGSFTGTQNPAGISVNGPIHQTADLMRISHELSLSLSGTDPDVHVGAPVGFGVVHLWLRCSTAGGATNVEADLSGSIPVVGFTAASGVFNAGDATHLKLILSNCAIGPRLLGSVAVADLQGGDLCLDPAADTGNLRLTSCPADGSLTYVWPADLGIRGLRTDGAPPCSSGRDCSTDEVAAVRLAGAASPAAVIPEPMPATSLLEQPHPNPFSDATEIRFALAAPSRVDLAVYDVRGRLVRRLDRADLPAGFHDIRWDGTDTGGRRVPAGVYFARLVTGDLHRTRKLVLVDR